MAKGKRQGDTVSVETESSALECYNRIAKHRSCWKHMVAYFYARGMKIPKQQAQGLYSFGLTSPCFFDTFPHQKRSKRRVKAKYSIPKLVTPKEKLNSGTFNCYFENLWRNFSKDKRAFFTYLDSLCFSMYMQASYRAKVMTLITKKQILSKKYVLVPIVYWSHWSLLIFCNFGESSQSNARTPCMLLLDSLEIANPRRFEPDIRKFVLDIYRSEGRASNKKMISKIPFLVPKVPQQRNDNECGIYVLYYINLFMQDAPEDFDIGGYPYFMKENWFTPQCLEQFFEKLN
ncbi:hypothetical protein K2173_026466 [Erythroxylum novogranatense]|uniref:Ubiquitin-like protease family profile domain-containing protein n=1 Tax=Erythroxylum novogranatense TaxID=1862640 RepID=A0AAV8TZ07_9ROSI|nr:hypothetical protein K2173_026466 [Erythroxylum novogranatense]